MWEDVGNVYHDNIREDKFRYRHILNNSHILDVDNLPEE